MPELEQHSSSYGQEFDWRTRVTNLVSGKIEIRQLMHSDYLLYPDGSLSLNEKIFTNSIAENLANDIVNCVTSNGYSKDLIYINSHAPEEVCYNSGEHPDHKITGNAVREAIDLLLMWFTIYNPISPKSGYWKVDINISSVRHKKSALCKACWETEFIAQPSGGYILKTWGENNPSEERRYPHSPLDFEYGIKMSYTATYDGVMDKFDKATIKP
jgi:hypothetical protein